MSYVQSLLLLRLRFMDRHTERAKTWLEPDVPQLGEVDSTVLRDLPAPVVTIPSLLDTGGTALNLPKDTADQSAFLQVIELLEGENRQQWTAGRV
jgi:hypothetical protein